MNLELFHIVDTNIKILDEISNENSYYGNFYKFFKNEISSDDYKKSLRTKFDALLHSTKNKIILKILKNTFLNHLSDFQTNDIKVYELLTINQLSPTKIFAEEFDTKEGYYEFKIDGKIISCYPIDNTIIKSIEKLYYTIEDINSIDDDVKNLSLRMFSEIKNKNIIDIYTILLKDNEKFYHYYLLYFTGINNNFDIEKNPIEIIVEDSNKIFIYEGIHRFILCLIKGINPIFTVIKSNYETYNKIISILEEDYNSMYKRMSPESLILYNKIPHTLFENFKSLREDRSEFVISYLKKHDCEYGLEIGPQNGLLSVQLSKEGHKIDCIEYEKKYYDLTKNVIEICGEEKNISVIYGDIYDFTVDNLKYDFIVSLSVFYHLKRNDKEKFETLFQELLSKTKILIFDDEPNTGILNQEEILNYIKDLEVTIETIHEGTDNRKIYAIVHNH